MGGDVDAKRQANIDKKEAERKAQNDEIKAKKAANSAKREEERAVKEKEEGEKKAKQDETAKKRDANVAAKEAGRANKGGSKYSKKDVMELKKVFDEYDTDKSGKVSADEFYKKLKERKEAAKVRPGEKSTLEQRKAQEGTSLSDLSEGAFREMDKDGDGEVEFKELLKLMYRMATDKEIQIMLEWVAPEPEPEPEPKPELSKEAKDAINQIFKLYDKDKSGTLTFAELKKALVSTGIDPEEIQEMFNSYDTDDNKEIDKKEFLSLMESTGAFDDM